MPTTLLEKIETRAARVVVMGLGYAGLPLALELARAGFRTVGLELELEKVRALNAGQSYIADVASEELAPLVASERLRATQDATLLRDADVVIVCVQTPLNKTREPDLRPLVQAVDQIAEHQHAGMLIVLESTSYPGTTTEILVPKLTAGGYALGESVHIAFSPERVDPGNARFKLRNTPKVLAGATPACLAVARALYAQVVDELVPVSSTATAEMVKLLENTFRAVNIALVNEMAIMSRRVGVDPFEVMRAAATKPFGFMPFYPGPGLGGHCLPVDPLYLSWKLETLDYQARFIALADAVNASMPQYVVERLAQALESRQKSVAASNILLYGVAYKADVSDVRQSPAVPIIEALRKQGARVAYLDPLVPTLELESGALTSLELGHGFGDFDAVVLVTAHSALDRARLVREASLIVDTRGALAEFASNHSKIWGL
ncbi:MAG TPA: nucleotide sugar dehydrogenase [Polyangiaceae bacterium]